MKYYFLFVIIYILTHQLQSQNSSYNVDIQKNMIGEYSTWVETDESIHTFTSIDINFHTLSDTINFNIQTQFTETFSGDLIQVSTQSSKSFFKENTIRIEKDSIFYQSLGLRKIKQKRIFGPEGVRLLSIDSLDSIGKKILYQTYVPDFNQIVTIQRKLLSYTIENAQKVLIVEEKIAKNNIVISKFDNKFNLIESSSGSPYGKIRIKKSNQKSDFALFPNALLHQNRILSNIRLPDPLSIDCIQVEISSEDSLNWPSIPQFNQVVQEKSSKQIVLNITNQKEKLPSQIELRQYKKFEIDSSITIIADSIIANISEETARINALANYCYNLDTNMPHSELAKILQVAGYPSRIVFGYTYDNWFWIPRFWVEVGSNGKWMILDPLHDKKTNSALIISIFKGSNESNITDFYTTSNLSSKIKIRIKAYEVGKQKKYVSKQVLPYFFEYPVYENEGLGIKFEIPAGFEIIFDGTKKPSSTFLVLENLKGDIIKCRQIIPKFDQTSIETKATNLIRTYLNDPSALVEREEKSNLWHAQSNQKGAIVIPQGQSILLFSISSDDAGSIILFLAKKNIESIF